MNKQQILKWMREWFRSQASIPFDEINLADMLDDFQKELLKKESK